METTYTTKRGYALEFIGIRTLIEKLEAQTARTRPEVPTYSVPTLAGPPETHAHFHRWTDVPEIDDSTGAETGKTVQREETSLKTEEDRAQWADYEQALRIHQSAHAEKFVKLVLLKGIKVLDKPADEDWLPTYEFMGLEVPPPGLEREYYWLSTELAADDMELQYLILGVVSASGAPEEVISEKEALFRRPVGGSGGDAVKPTGNSNGHGTGETVVPLETV